MVTCRKLILGGDIGLGLQVCNSWYDLYLTFDLAVVILMFKILSGNISETVKCRKLILGRDIA